MSFESSGRAFRRTAICAQGIERVTDDEKKVNKLAAENSRPCEMSATEARNLDDIEVRSSSVALDNLAWVMKMPSLTASSEPKMLDEQKWT